MALKANFAGKRPSELAPNEIRPRCDYSGGIKIMLFNKSGAKSPNFVISQSPLFVAKKFILLSSKFITQFCGMSLMRCPGLGEPIVLPQTNRDSIFHPRIQLFLKRFQVAHMPLHRFKLSFLILPLGKPKVPHQYMLRTKETQRIGFFYKDFDYS